MTDLDAVLAEARACRHCEKHLPLGPRPVLRASPSSRVLIVGQAPGTKVHETGIPWNDASGDRLRDWLGVTRDVFYDEKFFAIVPMGFCYPGRQPRGGDNPPRPECAPMWHPRLRPLLPNVRLTLLVGSYAQAHYLGDRRGKTMTDTVRAFLDHLPAFLPTAFLPTPHPSWRTTHWIKKNPWFERELLPELRSRICKIID